jgi:hypothetical protein
VLVGGAYALEWVEGNTTRAAVATTSEAVGEGLGKAAGKRLPFPGPRSGDRAGKGNEPADTRPPSTTTTTSGAVTSTTSTTRPVRVLPRPAPTIVTTPLPAPVHG